VSPRFGALTLAGIALLGSGAWLASGAPRLTMLNAALRLDHPWGHPAGALMAACGMALCAAAWRHRGVRLVAAALAAAALLFAARLALYPVELNDTALISENLLQRTEIPWARIGRVEVAPSALLVFQGEVLLLRLDTGQLSADQLATLKRGVARRVREVYEPPRS
jgi:hypothetical protein